MRGLIITNQEVGHSAYKIERFKEEFSKLGVSLEIRKNDGSLTRIEQNNIKQDIIDNLLSGINLDDLYLKFVEDFQKMQMR